MAKKKTNEPVEAEISEDKIIEILDFLGYKKIKEGNSYFFLPKRNLIKFDKKITRNKINKVLKNE